MINERVLLYLIAIFISLGIGIFASKKLIPENGESSPIAKLISWFSGIGIGFTTFGILFLFIHAISEPYKDKRWDQDEVSVKLNVSSEEINSSNDINLTPLESYEVMPQNQNNISIVSEPIGRVTLKKQDDFSLDTLEFNEKSSSTATIIFTVAGLGLGALGVFWLGFLETNRLQSARVHDQKVQNDSVRSLLKYVLALLSEIDQKVLNFKVGYSLDDTLYEEIKKLSLKETDKIDLKNKKFEINLFALEKHRHDEVIREEFERHVHVSYKFLFDRVVAKKGTVLEEIERVVLLIEQFMLEKDFKLYDDSTYELNAVGKALITLVDTYKSYLNTINGIDSDTDLTKNTIKNIFVDYNKLLKHNADQNINPLLFLRQLYEAKQKRIFYEMLIGMYSYDFTRKYLINNSELFYFFDCEELSDMFILMDYVHLDVRKFFLAYFEKAFFQYVEKIKCYKTIELSTTYDLDFEEYITVLYNTFNTIKGEKRSLSKLFHLYQALCKLDELLPKKDGET